MDGNELKHAIKHCVENHCIGCLYRDDIQCVNHIMSAADSYIAELEERIAIMQESMAALEKRQKNPDRINVTHCKDCKHLFDGEQTENCCDVLMEKTGWMHEISVSPDWYCADGETR